MNDKNAIPFIAYEVATARQERTIVRLWIVCLILIFALLGTNAAWIYYESQFDETQITQQIEATADDSSDLNLNTVGGDYYGGESESETNGQN